MVVLARSNTIWILRPDNEGGYRIVGDAYIHGLAEVLSSDPYLLRVCETLQIH